VSLRDLRLDLDDLKDDKLRKIIDDRGNEAPPPDATHEQLVCAASKAVYRMPVVPALAGHFGCTFNGVEYLCNNGSFEVPTVGLQKDQLCAVNVYWQPESDQETEAPHRISLSGFPTVWKALNGEVSK